MDIFGPGVPALAILALAAVLILMRGSGRRERPEDPTGREAVVVSFHEHEGRVTVDGASWPARLDGSARTPAPGDRVRVVAADRFVVWVRPQGVSTRE